jgi:hypothetical protein
LLPIEIMLRTRVPSTAACGLLTALLVVSPAARADGPSLEGGAAVPAGLQLTGCGLDARAISGGGIFKLTPKGQPPQIVWAGLVGDDAHLVFAWPLSGRKGKSHCVDAGGIDPWVAELSVMASLPVIRGTQFMRGGCFSMSRTIVLAWTSAAHDFELLSNRTDSSPRMSCGDDVAPTPRRDTRLERAAAALRQGERPRVERLLLELVGEQPWNQPAREALERLWASGA